MTIYVDASFKNREISAQYVELAIDVLAEKDNDTSLRTWAVDVLSKFSPVGFGVDLRKNLVEAQETLPTQTQHFEQSEVSVELFLDHVTDRGLIEINRLTEFVKEAIRLMEESRDSYIDLKWNSDIYQNRWDLEVTGGRVFIYRVRGKEEFRAAYDGVIDVFKAIDSRAPMEHIYILLATEKFSM